VTLRRFLDIPVGAVAHALQIARDQRPHAGVVWLRPFPVSGLAAVERCQPVLAGGGEDGCRFGSAQLSEPVAGGEGEPDELAALAVGIQLLGHALAAHRGIVGIGDD